MNIGCGSPAKRPRTVEGRTGTTHPVHQQERAAAATGTPPGAVSRSPVGALRGTTRAITRPVGSPPGSHASCRPDQGGERGHLGSEHRQPAQRQVRNTAGGGGGGQRPVRNAAAHTTMSGALTET